MLSSSMAKEPGVYLFLYPYEDRYLVQYVGQTKRSMGERILEHIQSENSGFDAIYDTEDLDKGVLKTVWPGMWGVGRRGWSSSAYWEEMKVFREGALVYYNHLRWQQEKLRIAGIPIHNGNDRDAMETGIATLVKKCHPCILRADIRYKQINTSVSIPEIQGVKLEVSA